MSKYTRGTNPNSRNGFKRLNKYGKFITLEEAEDLRRLHQKRFQYDRRCKRKNIEMVLTDEEFLSLVKSDCAYCGEPWKNQYRRVNRWTVNMGGIDRKDNTRGYTVDNCVPCCKDCNTIKMTLSFDAFMQKIKRIYLNSVNLIRGADHT